MAPSVFEGVCFLIFVMRTIGFLVILLLFSNVSKANSISFSVAASLNIPLQNDSVKKHPKDPDSIRQERIISAILAAPLPTGIVGGHRIYLGTKPHIPIVYIATFGGFFGILPFIDFCVILTADSEKLKSFENNPQLFMWLDRKK